MFDQQQQLAALQQEVAHLRQEVRQQRRHPRRGRLLLIGFIALLAALAPLSLFAAGQFSDVDSNSVHANNIIAIRNAGITTGCNPAANLYCPNNYVRRDEMASFLARTAGIGGNPPVVNALTAVTAQNATHAGTADVAGNAGAVQGWPANTLVRTNLGASGTPLALTTGIQTIVLTGVNAPAAGFLIVMGAGTFYATSGPTVALASTRVADYTSGVASYPLYATVGTQSGSALEQSMSPTWVFQVGAAGAHTIALEALLDPSSIGSVAVDDIALSVVYVPFGPGGAIGTELGTATGTSVSSWPAHPAPARPTP
jgi:hypothetical protein